MRIIKYCILFLIVFAITTPSLIYRNTDVYDTSVVYSPETLEKWLIYNTVYQKDKDGYCKSAKETIRDKGGDCEDYAILAESVLKRLGYKEGYILAIIFYENGERLGHAIYVFKDNDGTYSWFTTTHYYKTNYTNLWQIIYEQFPDWTKVYHWNNKCRSLKTYKRSKK